MIPSPTSTTTIGRRRPIGIAETSGARTAITAVTSRAAPSNCILPPQDLPVEIWRVLTAEYVTGCEVSQGKSTRWWWVSFWLHRPHGLRSFAPPGRAWLHLQTL